MADTIATLLVAPKTINVSADAKGPQRHLYDELTDLQSREDPVLASPYLQEDAVATILPMTEDAVSGNFTITISFPKYDVEVTTANIAFDEEVAAIRTKVDSALAGEVMVETYTASDVTIALSQNLNDTTNSAILTFDGDSVLGTHAVVTTQNAGDLGVEALGGVTATLIGTMNRPAEATLAQQSVIMPDSAVTPQGTLPSEGDYVTGDNPQSLSPGLKEALVNEMVASENKTLGEWFRTQIGCIG